MNRRRILALVWKEWREIVRDRLFLTLAFVVPSALMLVFGYGISLDVENIPFAVVDHDKSATSRELLHRYIDSRYFDYRGDLASESEIEPLIADSKIRLAIIVPPAFEERLRESRAVAVQTVIDGTFPFRTATSKGYVAAINAAFNTEQLAQALSKRMGIPLDKARTLAQPIRVEMRYMFNQAIRSTWSIASVLVMFVLMITPPFLTALGVVREKENGSIYNIYSSTATRSEFLIGKLAPYLGISIINSLILWFLATQLFGTPFKGNPLFFLLAAVVFVTCTTGIGLLVSLMVRTQVAAMMLTVIVTIIPSVLYSGLLVPIASMEPIGQFEAHLFPAVYFTDIVLGSFLKGIGMGELWGRLLALLAYSALLWTASFLIFHKRPKA